MSLYMFMRVMDKTTGNSVVLDCRQSYSGVLPFGALLEPRRR